MNKSKVSIVVPVYNVEEYLDRCLNSLINQSHKNIEIVVVNDGSTDNGKEVCLQYSREDIRINYIEQENQGLSGARNTGIINATGEYLMFVDSDDYIELDAVETLLEYAVKEQLEIVCSKGAYRHQDDESIEIFKEMNHLTKEIQNGTKIMTEYVKQGTSVDVVWLNLYRMELIKSHNLYFINDLLHEDALWSPQVFLKANRVMIIDYIFYNYIERDDSITGKIPTVKNSADALYIWETLSPLYNNISNLSQRWLLKDMLARSYMASSANLVLSPDYIEELHKKIIDRAFIIRNMRLPTTLLKAVIYFTLPSLYNKLK